MDLRSTYRILGYFKYFKKNIALNIFFNTLFSIFSFFTLSMLVPFLGLLFGSVQAPLEEPAFTLSDKTQMMEWFSWQLVQFKDNNGVFTALITVSVIYLIFSFLSNMSRYLGMFFLAPIRNGFIMHIRNDLYNKITILPLSFFYHHRKGDLLSRFSNDLNDIEYSICIGIQQLTKEGVNAFFFLILLIIINPGLLLFLLVIAPVALYVLRLISSSLKRNSEKGQRQVGSLIAFLEETLSNIRIIQIFSVQEKQEGSFREINQTYAKTNTKVLRRQEIVSPLTETFIILVVLAVLVYGGNMVFNQTMDATVLILFIALFAVKLLPSLKNLTTAFYQMQKGNAAAKRIYEVLDADEKIVEKQDAIVKKNFETAIEYRNVEFAYENDENKQPVKVLDNINITIEKGENLAIVGPSGAGKTTFVDLLSRFYDCTSGTIFIDGVSVKDLNINGLRAMIGIVSQDCILFNDTVMSNVAFGMENISEEAVKEACRIANAEEFIEQLPNKYETKIGDRGLNLSGGQRQRLSIARAVLKNPPILVLDEATSALDSESERLVQDALQRLMQNRTSIVIAHRLSTILNADRIIVLEKGHIIQQGTHAQLLKEDGLYKKLFELQRFE